MSIDEHLRRASELCDQVVFAGENGELAEAELALDAVEAELALVRGRVLHSRFLDEGQEDARELAFFERAVELFERVGDVSGEARARFQVGVFHQVVRGDHDAAMPELEKARELAERGHDGLVLSYALRHLGVAAHMGGRLGEARELLEESTRLRRERGFASGVAANLVGLGYVALAEKRYDDADELLEEAGELAREAGARRVVGQAEQAAERVRQARVS